MNKKDIVRTKLLAADDNEDFTIDGLANICKVEPKDVSNVVAELHRNGSLTRKQTGKIGVYTVVKNTLQLWFAKHPIGGRKEPNKNDDKPSVPRRIRPPFLRAIDAEIQKTELQLKKLKSMRIEYAS